MGCSSSALNKAGDSSRFRSGGPSNEDSSPGEQSKFCVAQPTPCTPGREATFYGSSQRASHTPLERPKASVMPTANGVRSCHQPSLANDEAPRKDATEQSGLAKKTELPLVQGEAPGLPQAGDKEDPPEMEEMEKAVEIRTEAETEPLGAEVRSQPLRTSGERDPPGAGEDTEKPHTAAVKLLEAGENAVSLETAQELPPEEAAGKDAQPQIIEAIPKENSSPEILGGRQVVENVEQEDVQEALKDKHSQLLEAAPKEKSSPGVAEAGPSAESGGEQRPQETPRRGEQPQCPETVLGENETPQVPDGSQPVQTPATGESLCATPDGTRSTHESQPEATADGRKPLAETAAGADVEMAREVHTGQAEQHIEGETGEKVETRMKNEKESEEVEANEKETGEAVDAGAAGDSGGGASAHSVP